MKKYFLLIVTALFTTVVACSKDNKELDFGNDKTRDNSEIQTKMILKIGNQTLTATLEHNSSAEALVNLLKEKSLTIDMSDYANMEKVGPLGHTLPRNDKQITAQPGDIILYQGNALVIYYAPNSWNFTRLGKIDNFTAQELKDILGESDVQVTLSLPAD